MPYSHFTTLQITPLLISAVILCVSVLLFNQRRNYSLGLLFIGTIVMGYFMANLDHFLILWDEQYHALVAKNLSSNLLKPTLILNPILDYDFKNWTANHIWLHKQPLFLWQMALSVKLFGTSALAIRLPSILMHAVIPLFIYRIGKLVINEKVGYYAAILFGVAYFPLELVAGRYSTDHNDMAFLFYVTGSFWAWFEFEKSKNKYWLIIIGLFSGGAVLVKWLMGLLVYVIWLFTKISVHREERWKPKSYLPMMYSGILSLAVFTPWQVYISMKYPLISTYEYNLNSAHFFRPVEGHRESIWYYFTDGFNKMYGSGALVPFILFLGVILLIINIPNKVYKTGVSFVILFVYLFYTLAATKMVSFTVIAFPFVYLGLGYLIYSLVTLVERKINSKVTTRIFTTFILMFVVYTVLDLSKIQNSHTFWKPHDNHNRIGEQVEMQFIKSLKEAEIDEEYVIFNASITVNGHIPIMFYTDWLAYDFIPTPLQVQQIYNSNRKIAVLDLGNLPDYIVQDNRIKILTVINKKLLNARE